LGGRERLNQFARESSRKMKHLFACLASFGSFARLPGDSARRSPGLAMGHVNKNWFQALLARFPARARLSHASRRCMLFRGGLVWAAAVSACSSNISSQSGCARVCREPPGHRPLVAPERQRYRLRQRLGSLAVCRPTTQSSGRRSVASERIETPWAGAAYFER
jgi:hypothetical protein